MMKMKKGQVEDARTGEADTHTNEVSLKDKKGITCPVCGGILRNQLPNVESIVDDMLYFTEGISIVDSEVTVKCEFDHCRDEDDEDFPLEHSHLLVAVLHLTFDTTGTCSGFEIVDVLPWQKSVAESSC
jgi:hypothetical protein